jgi:glycosyltransferase involved in cell wall biosynthesis
MRILILTQHFAPEITAARSRLQPFAELLAGAGHEVQVLTAVPNHPEGIVQPEYRGKRIVDREMDGYRVRYVWVSASPQKTMRTRLKLYGSFATMATLGGLTLQRPDVILATSPPLPVAAAARALAIRHRAPWVMDVRDIWPEAAVVLGELTNPRMIRAAERLERSLYASAAAIVTVTDAFGEDIAAKVGSHAKISIVRNGTTALWMRAGEAEPDRAELGIGGDEFLLTYAGNVGIAQGLEVAIDAAALLDDGYRLLIIGEGPMLGQIKERAEALPPGRVQFHPLVQPELAARLLRASDATLVPLAARPELSMFVPSKLFDCCAVGRPVILAAEGESRHLAADAGAVLPVPPGDPEALAGAVRSLRDDAGLRERLSAAGRGFAAEFLRERQIDALERVLVEAAGDLSRA